MPTAARGDVARLAYLVAALHLAATFNVPWHREEEPVKGTRPPKA